MSKLKGKGSVEARLLASLKQAVEIHRDERKPARTTRVNLTARDALVARPTPITAEQIVAIRQRWRVSQAVLARALNVSDKTVQSWEQGDRMPNGSAVRLLDLARQKPDAMRSLLLENPSQPPTERRSGRDRRAKKQAMKRRQNG